MAPGRGISIECGVVVAVQPQVLTRSADRIIATIASRQHGAVERGQLLRAGITAQEIATRLKDGRLRQIHRGVHLVGPIVGERTYEMAALLACGARAVLSHRSAAALWDLLPYPATAPVWVTIPPEQSARRSRIKVVRARVGPRDLRRRHRMTLTSPPRTVLDLAFLLDAYELEAVVAEAHFRRLAREGELRSQLDRNPGKRGAARLRRVLDLPGGPQLTRSPAERSMLKLLRKAGITGFTANAKLHGYEVDFLWRDLNFVVEVDGYDGHSGRVAFERDRLKQATLQARGVTVMRVTGRQIRRDPDGVLARLQQALSTARRAGM
jgi:very-short-patch-repair endonuclease